MLMKHYPIPKDLLVFITVVKKGSFNTAAEALGQTPAFVTKRIQQLESQLNTRLLHRTSRSVTLTDAGIKAYDKSIQILEQYQLMLDDLGQVKTNPEGKVRIGCSFGFGRNYIAPGIAELMTLYPDLQIHFELFDRQIDLAVDDIDLDIRVNNDIPQNCIAKLLTQNRRILCAAPCYIEQHGEPKTLKSLSEHECLITKERDQTFGVWELEENGTKKSIKLKTHMSSNSGEIILQWALNGKGIILRSQWDVQPLITSGQLIQVLPTYFQSANVWAVYQTPLISSAKLRACVEFFSRYFIEKPFL